MFPRIRVPFQVPSLDPQRDEEISSSDSPMEHHLDAAGLLSANFVRAPMFMWLFLSRLLLPWLRGRSPPETTKQKCGRRSWFVWFFVGPLFTVGSYPFHNV